MKRTVTVIETLTYFIEVDADESMDAYNVEILAQEKWNDRHLSNYMWSDYEVEFFAREEA
jgi:hypothetical protein